MQNINRQDSEEEIEVLPDLAWFLLLVAFVPHLLALIGSGALALIASCGWFPASMGPFSLAHAYLIVNRLGYTSHMSWISALSFSLIWSAFLYFSWQKHRTTTLVIGAFSFIVSAVWLWLLIAPLSSR